MLYLVQGDNLMRTPCWFKELLSAHSDMLFLSFKTFTGYEIFFPNSTLSEGRNLLYVAGKGSAPLRTICVHCCGALLPLVYCANRCKRPLPLVQVFRLRVIASTKTPRLLSQR